MIYAPIKQRYGGAHTTTANFTLDIEAYKKLTYLQVPLLLEFNFSPTSSVQPILSLGASYNKLLAYNIHYISSPYGEHQEKKNEIEKYYVLDLNNNPTRERTITASESFFNESVLLAHFGFGLITRLNDNVDLALNLSTGISFVDLENKSKMNFTYDYGPGTQIDNRNYNPYTEFVDFTRPRLVSQERGKTTIRNIGLQFGITYKLFKRSNTGFN